MVNNKTEQVKKTSIVIGEMEISHLFLVGRRTCAGNRVRVNRMSLGELIS